MTEEVAHSSGEIFLANRRVRYIEGLAETLCRELTGDVGSTMEETIERIRRWAAGRSTRAWAEVGDTHVLTEVRSVVLAEVVFTPPASRWRTFVSGAVGLSGVIHGEPPVGLVKEIAETAADASPLPAPARAAPARG